MAARLALLCHASTAELRSARFPGDEPLDATGERETQALKGHLPVFARSWTSPALRARRTAQLLDVAAVEEPALADIDYGQWKGSSMAEIAEREPKAIASWLADPSAKPHGGESIRDLTARLIPWLDRQMEAGGRTLAITHQAVIRAAIVHVLGAGALAFWRIDIEPLSLTELSSDGKRWNLRQRSAWPDSSP